MKKWMVILAAAIMMLTTLSVVMADSPGNGKGPPDGVPPGHDTDVKLGVDVLLEDKIDMLEGKNVGLITNPTGVDQELNSIVDTLHNHDDVNLVSLYGPEHGVRGSAQAGEYVEFYIDEKTGLPVYSLYGETRKPTPEMLEDVDTLLFDIQDVGTRFYTYIYTMAYAMEAAAENDIEFVVLDRPNPLGGEKVEGPVLEPDYSSFVGMYPIPLRHGMTVGELAKLFNEEFDIGADLEVVEMEGWDRSMTYDETGLEFVMPSPNMPTLDTASVYPGAALIEGTNVSEGRGTTKPFELIGAPFINSTELAANLNEQSLNGVQFRAASFTPQFSKHSGELSHGVEIHVKDKEAYEPVETGVTIVKTIHDMYPEDFAFREENSEGISFFDNLIGNGWVRDKIENGDSVDDIVNTWQPELNEFKETREDYLLYEGGNKRPGPPWNN
ncbi:exo-beta-N-acetylmuramidase NamZ domain-containing protein [Lentibacillus amyloliquefaciens]|uniref:DUF1343 domain-containing protein n=1 Tax=Lentibacillus amyloliquefaciens TaxID=1472767 RepID=A0A0U4FV54_9BACI|nr:DUF1343 domain-containing protein [Lentibacillus amyloliquefaciens]ALX49669.1 hypothetical protein AOX59_14485 [Lentibacillus amyloliquefaciens]